MKITIPLLAILFAGTLMAKQAELFYDSVETNPEEGKPLKMELRETKREDKFSIVEVKFSSGASVPSIMFVVKGMYEIAKMRRASHFINLKEWEDENGNWMYKVGFTNTDAVEPAEYFGDDIDREKEPTFLSVKDYDILWGKK